MGQATFRTPEPSSQYSRDFIQGMLDRMGMSYHKYGHIADAVAGGLDPLAEVFARVRKYRATGNTEWLMDAANYLMIEFLHPSHDDAHFRATDSNESDGRAMRDGTRTSKHANQLGGDL